MKTGFLILIGVVLVCSILFGFLIWRQTVKFEKKAMAAKKRKEEYLQQLELQQLELQQAAQQQASEEDSDGDAGANDDNS